MKQEITHSKKQQKNQTKKKKTNLEVYEELAHDLALGWAKADMAHIHKLILENVKPGQTILELGCGQGRDAMACAKEGINVIATDGSLNLIQEAKKAGNTHENILYKQVMLPSLEGLKKEGEQLKVDAITSIATLMHLSIEDLNKTIDNITELIKEDGKLILSVSTNRDDTDEFGFDSKGRWFNNEMDNSQWVDEFEKRGFELKKQDIFGDSLGRNGMSWLTCVFEKKTNK